MKANVATSMVWEVAPKLFCQGLQMLDHGVFQCVTDSLGNIFQCFTERCFSMLDKCRQPGEHRVPSRRNHLRPQVEESLGHQQLFTKTGYVQYVGHYIPHGHADINRFPLSEEYCCWTESLCRRCFALGSLTSTSVDPHHCAYPASRRTLSTRLSIANETMLHTLSDRIQLQRERDSAIPT